VGPRVVEFLIKAGIDPSRIHCIGHSLGAHVRLLNKYINFCLFIMFKKIKACGFTAKSLINKKLKRITGKIITNN